MSLKKSLPILADFIKEMGQFYKNSVVISLVINQSQPKVFYLQKKKMNFMKMRTFYRKKNLLLQKLKLAYL